MPADKVTVEGRINLPTDAWLRARFRPKQVQAIKTAAELCGEPVMCWLRRIVLAAAESERERSEDR